MADKRACMLNRYERRLWAHGSLIIIPYTIINQPTNKHDHINISLFKFLVCQERFLCYE
jgi:hypothetical protein